eukprot:m.46241 g.46241  ORF g.46241 m.46241 type:complete len:860 (-) comp13128_c0_seq3:143-2722(-)
MASHPDWIHGHSFAVFFLGQDGEAKIKTKGTTVADAIKSTLALNSLEKVTIKYFDKDSQDYEAIQQDTDLATDLTPIPRFRVTVDGTFQLHRIFNQQRNCFRRFGNKTRLDLRDPQRAALKAIKRVWMDEPTNAKANNRFMAILPTGCGKTLVLALAPFVVAGVKRVLVIEPNLTLKDQIKDSLAHIYSPDQPVGKEVDGGRIRLRTLDSSHKFHKDDHIVVTNIQSLSKKVGDDDDYPRFLSEFKPDLVVIDEGHHSLAESWNALQAEAEKVNPNCKFLLLTATPKRGDGKFYELPQPQDSTDSYYYIFKRAEAIASKYIKQTQYHSIALPEEDATMQDESSWYRLLDPAVEKLKELRSSNPELEPVRMLVTVETNAKAKRASVLFNEKYKPLKSATIIGGKQNARPNGKTEKLFSRATADENNIDVVFQCQMLGEGYDNPWIIISVVLTTQFRSISRLTQTHGRALRVIPKVQDKDVKALTSHLFYPSSLKAIVQGYMDGKDEEDANLFEQEVFPTFRKAHETLAKKPTVEVAALLGENFERYHELYSQERKNWAIAPAEWAASYVFNTFVGNERQEQYSIVDLGCGADALFEVKFRKLVAGRSDPCNIKITAVDVVKVKVEHLSRQQGGNKFECASFAGDYSSFRLPPQERFDCAIACLSIMGADSLEKVLVSACRLVKPTQTVLLVLPASKILRDANRGPVKDECKYWCQTFTSLTGFTRVSEDDLLSIDLGEAGLCYCLLLNNRPAKDLDQFDVLESKLRGVTLRRIKKQAYDDRIAVKKAAKARPPQTPLQSPLVQIPSDAPMSAMDDGDDDDDQPAIVTPLSIRTLPPPMIARSVPPRPELSGDTAPKTISK